MRFFNKQTDFSFMDKRKIAFVVSIIVILVSITSVMTRGLNFGIDFTGGTLVEVEFNTSVDVADVRGVLEANQFDDAIVSHFGSTSDILIRLPVREGQSMSALSGEIVTVLKTFNEAVTLRRVEFVGPQVGDELTQDGGLAMLYALIGILVYVSFRFEGRFALGAIIALVHDVIITVGVFSLTQMEFNLTVLAAVLAVIGYSLNDTIVIYDRVRENFRKLRKMDPIQVIDASLNQSLARTIVTSLTTLLVLTALLVLGGEIIRGFAVALTIGVLIGTYSSMFVAAPVLLVLGVTKEDLAIPVKEGADL